MYCTTIVLTVSESTFSESELFKTLLDPNAYNKDIIPQSTLDGPVVVKLGASLLSVVEIVSQNLGFKE
jgi:hypothetical protein